MGEVAIRYRVMPESMDVNLNELKEVLEDELTKNTINAKIQGIEEKEIAFGLKALHVSIVMPDAAGCADEIEKIISQIKGVQSIETIEMSLL